MPRGIRDLIAEVERRGFAIGDPIPIDGATAALFGNLASIHPDQCLLHYLPVHRFKSLITGRSLYLRRLDRFSDEFEGRLPAANDAALSDFTSRFMRQFGITPQEVQNWKSFNTGTLRKLTYVHCWFASESEDSSMWQDYAEQSQGVCIQTTARRLVTSLACPDHLGLDIRRVTYIGESDALPEIVSCLPAGRKQARPEFIREREVRVIATVTEQAWAAGFATPDGDPPDHQLVAVNFEQLFERVYVGPNASPAVFEEIEALANSAAGSRVVLRSTHSPYSPPKPA